MGTKFVNPFMRQNENTFLLFELSQQVTTHCEQTIRRVALLSNNKKGRLVYDFLYTPQAYKSLRKKVCG